MVRGVQFQLTHEEEKREETRGKKMDKGQGKNKLTTKESRNLRKTAIGSLFGFYTHLIMVFAPARAPHTDRQNPR